MNTNKLALENNLSRKILSLGFDKKGRGIITTQVSTRRVVKEVALQDRVEEYYFCIPEGLPPENLNEELSRCLHISTLNFLGLEDSKETPAIVEEKVEEKPAKKKAAKKAAKKATKKATKKVEIKEPIVAVEAVEAVEGDVELDLLDEVSAPTKIMFDKTNKDHRAALAPILPRLLGSKWKEDNKHRARVQELLPALDGKVAVMNEGSQDVLASFVESVKEFVK